MPLYPGEDLYPGSDAAPPAAGTTFLELQNRVLANSFNPTRYRDLTKDFLNEGVEHVCRRMGIYASSQILDHDADGVVDQPASPFFRVDALWTAPSTASGSGEAAVRRWARWQLEVFRDRDPQVLGGNGAPGWYTVRRAPAGAYAGLVITVHPASAIGKVAISGLTRPTVMVADTDGVGLASNLEAAAVAYAKARCFENEDDAQMAAYWDGRLETALRDNSTADDTDGPSVAPGTWDE